MIEAKIVNLAITDKGFVIILKPKGHEKVIPIFVGALESQSISIVLLGLTQPRPLTHDLFRNVLDSFSVRIEQVIVDDLRNDTFYAKMVLTQGNETLRIDARPSDAIAMALRTKSPIFVEEKVVEAAGIFLDDKMLKDAISPVAKKNDAPPFGETGIAAAEGPVPPADVAAKRESAPVSTKSKKEQLTAMLEDAVREERYEDAALLRDELSKLSVPE